jgi:hypothetical protein
MTDTGTVPAQQGEIVEPERKPRKRGNGKAVAVASEASAIVSQGDAMLALFERLARDPNVEPARIQQFLEMKRAEEDRHAVRAFNAAMAAAKAAFEPIVKRRVVDFENKGGGRTNYKHEDLADIEAAVKDALAEHGLSYRWRVKSTPNEPVVVTCVVTHRDGHFEETTLSAAADNTGGKNSIQAIGSTVAYLQRYTLKAGLGLAAGRDDDGNGASNQAATAITYEQYTTLNARLEATGSDKARFCRYFKIEGVALLPASKYAEAMRLLNQKVG